MDTPEVVQTETPAPPTIDTVAKDGSAAEYRAARAVKPVEATPEPVAEDVAPEPVAEAKPLDASEAGRQLAAHKSGLEKRKQSIQSEIDQLTKTKYDTKREADAIKAEIAALRAEKAALTTKPEVQAEVKPSEDPEPTPETFDSYDKYVKAQARWEARQEIKQELAAERARQQQEHRTRSEQSTRDRVYEAVAKDHPDLDELIAAAHADRFVFSPLVSEAVATLEQGPAVAYALLKDRAEGARLNAITQPVTFGLELSKLLTRLDDARPGPSAETKPVTQAPAPIKPVGSMPTASSRSLETVASSGSAADYRRLREARAR